MTKFFAILIAIVSTQASFAAHDPFSDEGKKAVEECTDKLTSLLEPTKAEMDKLTATRIEDIRKAAHDKSGIVDDPFAGIGTKDEGYAMGFHVSSTRSIESILEQFCLETLID